MGTKTLIIQDTGGQIVQHILYLLVLIIQVSVPSMHILQLLSELNM